MREKTIRYRSIRASSAILQKSASERTVLPTQPLLQVEVHYSHMHRRMYFRSIMGLGTIALAGCIDSGNISGGGDDTNEDATDDTANEERAIISGDSIELSPGDHDQITVHADNVGSVQFSNLPEVDDVVIDVNEAEFSDSPSGQDDADPPYWNWSPPDSSIDITVPVYIDENAESGDYHYAVSAWHVDVEEDSNLNRNEETAVTEEATITVGSN